METPHAVAVWVLGALALLFIFDRLFASINLKVG